MWEVMSHAHDRGIRDHGVQSQNAGGLCVQLLSLSFQAQTQHTLPRFTPESLKSAKTQAQHDRNGVPIGMLYVRERPLVSVA